VQENLSYIHQYERGTEEPSTTTLLLLHGTGGDENSLRDLGRMLLPDVSQLRLRGNVSEHGQLRFFRRFAEGVLDIADLQQRTSDLADFIQQASVRYGFAAEQVIGAGFSNGANIVASMLLLHPHVLHTAILLHPMFAFEPDPLPDLRGKPVFIGAGRHDPLVPTAQTEQLTDLLQRAGATVHVFWHNGGHTVSADEVKAIKGWLA
jgi:phospholipase/carboxylesterase